VAVVVVSVDVVKVRVVVVVLVEKTHVSHRSLQVTMKVGEFAHRAAA
jgi:hypothetical protein